MKKYLLFYYFLFITVTAFSQSISFNIIGNAHIFSREDLIKVLEMGKNDRAKISTSGLYQAYKNLEKSCGNNSILFEEKKKTDFANRVIRIYGNVKRVRTSILDEYIVELNTPDSWVYDIGVVYPKKYHMQC